MLLVILRRRTLGSTTFGFRAQPRLRVLRSYTELPILGFFLSFVIAGSPAAALHRLAAPLWAVASLSVALLALYSQCIIGLPFLGSFTELPLVLLASAAAAGPMHIFRLAGDIERSHSTARASKLSADGVSPAEPVSRPVPAVTLVLLTLCLPAIAFSLFELKTRLNTASWLG